MVLLWKKSFKIEKNKLALCLHLKDISTVLLLRYSWLLCCFRMCSISMRHRSQLLLPCFCRMELWPEFSTSKWAQAYVVVPYMVENVEEVFRLSWRNICICEVCLALEPPVPLCMSCFSGCHTLSLVLLVCFGWALSCCVTVSGPSHSLWKLHKECKGHDTVTQHVSNLNLRITFGLKLPS